jgi:hypothetical protein
MASKPEINIVEHAGPIPVGKPSRRRYRTATAPDGSTVRIRMIDPDSPTFTADLTDMFRENVRRARAENKALGLNVK